MSDATPSRSIVWKWSVCALLLGASMLMYMDRQTLPSIATRITREFHLSQEQYGELEMNFGYAFAAGALVFGIIADRITVRWLYPAVVIAWSAVGFLTGLVESHAGLLLCRTLLGFFESGHWPCALKTTQWLLSREQRTMGNSVLQSGASFGAILTPLVMSQMLAGRTEPGLWRKPFLIIGSLGVLWLVAWFGLLRKRDFAGFAQGATKTESEKPNPIPSAKSVGIWVIVRRAIVLIVMVACINTCWQIIRAWLPKFLQEGRGYTETAALYFNSLYYIATDVGCLGAGALSLWLVKRGFKVHSSRALVYGCCALLTTLTVVAMYLPQRVLLLGDEFLAAITPARLAPYLPTPHGALMLGLLLVVGAGALGLFPCYYSFTQELSTRHQGKVTGFLGTVAWISSSPFQKLFGWFVDKTGSFDLGIALAGTLPLIGLVFLWPLWNWGERKSQRKD